MKEKIVSSVAVLSTAALLVLCWRVVDFGAKHNCNVFSGRAPAPATATNDVRQAKTPLLPGCRPSPKTPLPSKDPASAQTNAPAVRVSLDLYGERTQYPKVVLRFSREPKIDEILRNVTFEPAIADLSVDTDYVWWRDEKWEVSFSSTNFQRRADCTLTVKPSFAFLDDETLGREFRRTFRLPGLEPLVRFADEGRYLPPVGEKALAVEVVNLTNFACSVRRVLPENIVQLLAREEHKYPHSASFWGASDGDSVATTEISAAPVKWNERVSVRPDVEEKFALHPFKDPEVSSNGVYLVHVNAQDDGDEEKGRFRLVCVSDLGLSVRRDDYGVRLWVTSLATGRPVPGLVANVYASSRVLLASGETDARGEVALSGWDSRYKPFAVVVSKKDGSDATFLAMGESVRIEESLPTGGRADYLKDDECTAFLWTERGIYRPGEKIMLHALLRNGKSAAPRSFPVEFLLVSPGEKVFQRRTAVADAFGAVSVEDFSVPADQPTGKWTIQAWTPGEKGAFLGERTVKVEDFVPPQVRVEVKGLPEVFADVTNYSYRVAAENLFGGPAPRLSAGGLVVFSDVDFAPATWKGFRFGDSERGLNPNHLWMPVTKTDEKGEAAFSFGFNREWGRPKAAMRLFVQGSILEPGGRPTYARGTSLVHYYPYYIGTDVPGVLRPTPTPQSFRVVQVNPDGSAHEEARALDVELRKIRYVYNFVYVRADAGEWRASRTTSRVPCASNVVVAASGEGRLALPALESGEYELVLSDRERGLSHRASFWLSECGDDERRASMKNPTAVTIVPDKAFYREGERPRLAIRSPFRGAAWLSVMREKTLYTRAFDLTNLTSVVELDPVDGAWMPNVDVAVSVVQGMKPGSTSMAARAHGLVALGVRTRESDLDVSVSPVVRTHDGGGGEVAVRVSAPGAANAEARAVVTVVDEAINMLTAEPTPKPVAFFATLREWEHPLYDLFHRLLPVCDESLRAAGAKTGGDGLAGLMNRMSLMPSRRFRPLSQWRLDVPLTNGVADVRFDLPEFVGEVRVTAVVYTKKGSGATSVRRKVCPKLVMQSDAPRFAAPGDRFDLTLTLSNRSGADAEVAYEVRADGAVALAGEAGGRLALAKDASKVLRVVAQAKDAVGEGRLVYRATGAGEVHEQVIDLPVRPAAAWDERAGAIALAPGESRTFAAADAARVVPEATQRAFLVSRSPVAELTAALEYLAEYPYGCLEQTVSQVFPLLRADDFLARLPSEKTSKASDAKLVVAAGVARVVSMMRAHDFSMWPDCDAAPWDREVSLYAAHFLVEAKRAGCDVPAAAGQKAKDFLSSWAYDADTNVAAYACHTLALMGAPNKDRMFSLYDGRASLSLLSRARLARGFVRIGDPKRARTLVADAALAPKSVREAATALLTLLELDAKDARIPSLVVYLQKARDGRRGHWGTTDANAHALFALTSYYRVAGLGDGRPEVSLARDGGAAPERLADGRGRRVDGGGAVTLANTGKDVAFVSYRELTLPRVSSVTNAHGTLRVARAFWTPDGQPADLASLKRGDQLVVEVALAADRALEVTDLVVQNLLPGCLEPDADDVAEAFRKGRQASRGWLLRTEKRDDRILAFSRPVRLGTDAAAPDAPRVFYAVRVVTAGEFVLPGVRVEAMYAPELFAQTAPERLVVR